MVTNAAITRSKNRYCFFSINPKLTQVVFPAGFLEYNRNQIICAKDFMHRFFLPPASFQNDEIVFSAETARQVFRVLRLHSGERVVVLDGSGMEYEVNLMDVGASGVTGRVVERRMNRVEPGTHLTLYLCLTQREKFEWMLQKCTEVGASRFVPVVSARSLVQEGRDAEKKHLRWQRIVQEAAEQSGRGLLPTVAEPVKFSAALQEAHASYQVSLFMWEGEKQVMLRDVLQTQALPNPARIAILIGPEGGFTLEEVEMARAAGLLPVSLGKRILRMETAALVAASLVLYLMGDMDSTGL